jgi:DNA-binding MarR family transcriptional regulator
MVEARMPSRDKVQNTHIREVMRRLHGAVIDLVGVINRPQADMILLREARLPLDRALFPLLVVIERRGPIGVGELADRVGRDYTTVSRQVAKLQGLGLVARRTSPADRRVNEAIVTDKGRAMTDAIDAARERFVGSVLAAWTEQDLDDLTRLMRRFADDLMAGTSNTGAS